MTDGRNVRIERDAQDNVIVTGDRNRIYVLRGTTSLPPALEASVAQGKSGLADISTGAERHPDIFLSHSHEDAEWVEQLALRLEDEHGFVVWLDRWKIIPGTSWQGHLAAGLVSAKCCAVCIGSKAPSGWFKQELEAALDIQAARPEFRVIPLITPGGTDELVSMSVFLRLRHWADFRMGKDADYALHVLVQGIKGEPVGRWSQLKDPSNTEIMEKLKLMARELQEFRAAGFTPDILVEYEQRILTQWSSYRGLT